MIVFDPAPAVVKNFDGVISYTPLPTGFGYHVLRGLDVKSRRVPTDSLRDVNSEC